MGKPTFVDTPFSNYKLVLAQWTLTNADPVGDWQPFPPTNDKTIHVYGTFDGGTVTYEGTNEFSSPSNPVPLHDFNNAVISMTSADMKTVQEHPYQTRPKLAGSGALASVTVVVCGKG